MTPDHAMKRVSRLSHALLVAGLVTAGAARAETAQTYFAGVPTNAADIWPDAALLIEEVLPDGPAMKAGVKPGDRLVGINGRRIRAESELKLINALLVPAGGLQAQVLRDGQVLALPLARLMEGRLGVNMAARRNVSIVRIACEEIGIKPTEYLGTAQGGRADGGVLDGLIAAYAPTNPTHGHPVLMGLDAFPARGAERIHLLAQAKRTGLREWVLGLLRAYYALAESRPADAQRHLKEARVAATPMDPFLDGLAKFYGQLAADPPGTQGVDLQKLGVTPEYFSLCYPAPVLPLKIHDWSLVRPKLARDIARAADGLDWEPKARQRAAARQGPLLEASTMESYLDYMHCAFVDCENHGGWPARHDAVLNPNQRSALLRDLKAHFATSAADRVTCALALLTPCAIAGDTDTYRQALSTLRDAGSRELGMGNRITRTIWSIHSPPAQAEIEAIQREVNASLGIPGVYTWLARRNDFHAELLQTGWYMMAYKGLWDGSARLRTPGTVLALGGPVELKPPPETMRAKPSGASKVLTVDIGDGEKMEFVWIAPGHFLMGDTGGIGRQLLDETQHPVTLTEGYWMGKYEVTRAQWTQVMGGLPQYSIKDAGRDVPVEKVTWDQCRTFLARINLEPALVDLRLVANLPTEAEWEYACRAGTTGSYAGDLEAMAWHNANSSSSIQPVGRKAPNTWGLHDMHGNVREWCADFSGDYPVNAVTNPVGPRSSMYHISRGGSWDGKPEWCQSGRRSYGAAAGYSYRDLGFRVMLR